MIAAGMTFWELAEQLGEQVLAERLGYSPITIRQMVNGTRGVGVRAMARCLAAFGDGFSARRTLEELGARRDAAS